MFYVADKVFTLAKEDLKDSISCGYFKQKLVEINRLFIKYINVSGIHDYDRFVIINST